MDHYRVSYSTSYYYPTVHVVHSLTVHVCSVHHREVHKLVESANLYEIFKDKIFVGASKTTKSMKILVLRLYGIYSY